MTTENPTPENPTPENPPTRQPGTNPEATPGSWDNPWDSARSVAAYAVTVNGQVYSKESLEYLGQYDDLAAELQLGGR